MEDNYFRETSKKIKKIQTTFFEKIKNSKQKQKQSVKIHEML